MYRLFLLFKKLVFILYFSKRNTLSVISFCLKWIIFKSILFLRLAPGTYKDERGYLNWNPILVILRKFRRHRKKSSFRLQVLKVRLEEKVCGCCKTAKAKRLFQDRLVFLMLCCATFISFIVPFVDIIDHLSVSIRASLVLFAFLHVYLNLFCWFTILASTTVTHHPDSWRLPCQPLYWSLIDRYKCREFVANRE